MAIQSASAKLYTGIRCWCVDKNISAALTASFSLGNKNRPAESGDTVYANVLAFSVKRFIADVATVPSVSLTDSRNKTFGGGNNVITAGSPRVINNTNNWKVTSSVVCKFPTYFRIDVEKLQLPEGTDCTVSFEEGWITDGNYLESTKAPSPKVDNFFTFRTPWYGLSFMNSAFTQSTAYKNFRPFASSITSAFTPSFAAKITRRGVIDLQSAFGAICIAGEIVRLTSRADLFVVAGPMGPGSQPFLEGNGYPYVTGLGSWPQGFPGIVRIKQLASNFATSTASVSAEVYNLPFIWTLENLSSEFTISPTCDAYKGVGTPHLQAQSSLSCAATVNYNSTVPTMQSSATVFCRTPVQASATLTAASSVSADIGQALELEWDLLTAGTTVGIVLKGPNINVTMKWSDGHIDYVEGGAYNPDIADAPTSIYYTRNIPTSGNVYVRIYGSLGGFQMSRNGVDYINGGINQDDSYLGGNNTWAVAGRNRLIACNGWGDLGITNLMGAFANCESLDTVPTFLPKNTTSTACMFLNCVNINDSSMLTWDTSSVTSMAGMFRQASQFNQPIGVWDTGSVIYMSRMFRGGNSGNYPSTLRDSSFNQSLNGWDVTNVSRANMTEMFYYNEVMSGNCNQWCVSHISTAPTNFTSSTTTTWPTANRPIWGTCP